MSILPQQAKELLDAKGYAYLDVRTEEEFDAGRPAGAWNVPVVYRSGGQVSPNPDFFSVVQAHFPQDAPIVVGCRSGSRSEMAVQLLRQAGYTNVYNMLGGFSGTQSPAGEPIRGWSQLDYPTDSGPGDRTYDRLRKQAEGEPDRQP